MILLKIKLRGKQFVEKQDDLESIKWKTAHENINQFSLNEKNNL